MRHESPVRRSGAALPDIAAAILALVALGCEPAATNHVFNDEGKLCLFPGSTSASQSPFVQPTVQVYEANRALDLTVVAPTCLSSSCSHDQKAECTAVLTGNVIEVKSAASFREQGDTCTTDCRALIARCTTPALPAGTYQVRHGATTLTITVPSTAIPPCGGKGIGGE